MIFDLTMKPEAKKVWVAALRSGVYAQGVHSLCYVSDEGVKEHCCLGVFAKVQKVPCLKDSEDPTKFRFYFGDRPPHLTMPNYEWFGKFFDFHNEDVSLKESQIVNLATKFANMNDLDKWSFSKIADWIEQNL